MELTQNTTSSVRKVATIAGGASDSSAIQVGPHGFRGLAVLFPAEWTAADLAVKVSTTEDGTYTLLETQDADGNADVVRIKDIATGAASYRIFPAEVWAAGAMPYIKLASIDTADQTAEAQGAARSLIVVFLS